MEMNETQNQTREEVQKDEVNEEVVEDKKPEEEVKKESQEEPEKVEGVKADEDVQEETITISKAKYEEILKNKFAEGVRKAEKGKNEDLSSQNEALALENVSLKEQLNAIQNVVKMDTLGVQKERQEDLIAIIKGKGLELNEATITSEAENHPEWKKKEAEKGVDLLGQNPKETEDERIKNEKQRQKDRALFGLK